MDNYDAEQLIQAVEARPAIWDMRNPDYKDRTKRKQAWEEIVNLVVEEPASDDEKKQIGDALIKKWKHLRDRYSREVGKSPKTRSGTGKKTPYVYSRQMAFLKDVIENRPIRSSNMLAADDEDEVRPREESSSTLERRSASAGNPIKRLGKKRRLDCSDRIMTSREVCHPKERGDDEHFLLSLLPILKTIPPEYKIASRIEVMQVLSRYVRNQTGLDDISQYSSQSSMLCPDQEDIQQRQYGSTPILQSMYTPAPHSSSFAQTPKPLYKLLKTSPHPEPSTHSPSISEESSVGEDSNLSLF